MKCLFCQPENKYQFLHIKNYRFWHVELRNEQNYLGWCFIVLNRHLEDLMDISEEEQREFFKITKNLRNVIKKQFNVDSFNYASLGNVTNHVHLQIIPRYSKTVRFQGLNFIDNNWGKNYSPYDKSFDIPKDIKVEITSLIEKKLS